MLVDSLYDFNDKIIISLLMSKNYFGFLDSRNTKYQGVIRNDHFDGVGIAIDQHLNTVLTSWKKYSINGPSVIIFSSLEIFFGNIEDGLPKGVVCFQYSHKERLFIKFETDKNASQPTFTQVALTVHNSEVIHLQKAKDKDEYKIIHSYYSKSEDNTLKILSNIFSTSVSKYQIDLVEYLSHEFVEQLEVFELTGSGKEVFFGFKGVSSLGFKLENGVPVALGFWNMFPRNLMFGRKVYYNLTFPQKTKLEQGNFAQSSTIYKWAKSQTPSADCIKCVQEYFKKSTTFRNQFTKFDQIKKLFKSLKQVEEKIKVQVDKKHGQKLLEQQDVGSDVKNEQVTPREYTLEEVKKQIYQAAAKKHSSFKSTTRSPFQSSFKKQPKYNYDNLNRSRGKYTDEYRVNEFNVSYQAKDIYEDLSLKQEIPQKGITQKNFKDTSKTKVNLLKDVDEIVKKRKENQNMLWNDLMINDRDINRSQHKYTENLNESPITKKYRRYELRTGTNEKQQKYEAKTIPFQLDPSISQRKQTVRVVPKRQIKYLQADKQNQPELEAMRMPKYDLFKPGADRINEKQHILQQRQSKAHSNLAKYKDRLKDSTTPSKQSHQKPNRYQYLYQASKANDDQMPATGEKLMSQLKLFNVGSETNQKKFNRSYTDNGEMGLLGRKDQLMAITAYNASEPRERPRRAKLIGNEELVNNETLRGRPRVYEPNERRVGGDSVIENDAGLVKMYTFQDRTLSDKLINITSPTLDSQKKPKRTYQYVNE